MSDTPQAKKSNLGGAALVAAIVAGLALLAALATAIHAVSGHSLTRPTLAAIGTLMVGSGLLELVALGLGIAALRDKTARRQPASAAIAIAAVGLVVMLVVITTGIVGQR